MKQINEITRMQQIAGVRSKNLLTENPSISKETTQETYNADYLKGYGDGYTDGYSDGEKGNERAVELNEFAKIKDQLKASIEKVIADNPDLNGLPLKKAIRSDQDVLDALEGDTLYDNQLNKFIALQKGERQVGTRGRKPTPKSLATKDVIKDTPKSKIKIEPVSSSDEIDDTIGTDAPSSGEEVSAANNFKNIINKKVTKIEKMDPSDRESSVDMKALKQFIKKPEVKKALGVDTIKGLVSSLIG